METKNKELREYRLSDVKVFPESDSKWRFNQPVQKWIDENNLKGRAYMQSCEVTDIYLSDKYFHEGIVVTIHENENRQRDADARTFHFQVVNELCETKNGVSKYKDVVKIRYVEGRNRKKGDGYFYSQSLHHPHGPEVDRPIDMLSGCLSYSESFSKNVIKAILAFNELAQEAISKLKNEIAEHNRKIKQEEKDKQERKKQYEKLKREFG